MAGGILPIATGTSPHTGTIPIGPLTRRILIMRTHLCGITPTLGSMDTMLRTIVITQTTILIETSISGITVEVGMSRFRGVPTTTEVLGVVKADVRGVHVV